MFKAFISPKGNCIVVPTQFTFTAGEPPKKDIVSWCAASDPQFDEFVQFCKEQNWM